MSQPYVGEIRMFGGNFAPSGWAFCDGQLLPISENEVLFQLIGTTYGGDGQETFALPDLRGRGPVHQGTGPGLSARTLGEQGGVGTVTLTQGQLAGHNHTLIGTPSVGSSPNAANAILAQSTAVSMYIEDAPSGALATGALAPVGGSQPHENHQPYLPIRFIISLFGVFPQQN